MVSSNSWHFILNVLRNEPYNAACWFPGANVGDNFASECDAGIWLVHIIAKQLDNLNQYPAVGSPNHNQLT